MKTIQKTMGWLVMAAALTIGTTACSSDDMLAENNEPTVMPQAQQKVHITVGAGVGTSGTTRSSVDYNSETKERTLKFTDGDKLYVRAIIEQEHDDNYDDPEDPNDMHDSKIMAGFLTIDPATISADGKSAQFTGDLDIYNGTVKDMGDDDYDVVYDAGTHTFTTADPLAECLFSEAQLVHEGSEANYYIGKDKSGYYPDRYLASSVEELMTSSYSVGDQYNENDHAFTIFAWTADCAILNCTISGLTPGASYVVRLDYDDEYNEYEGKVAANGDGKANFAIVAPDDEHHFQLLLASTNDRKQVNLGQKELETKVYNIKATASDWVLAGMPIVTGTLTLPGWDKEYYITDNPFNFTISGTSTNYSFCLDVSLGGTIHLVNVAATHETESFIYGDEGDVNIELTGNNTVSVPSTECAINWNGNMKLSCTGASATLTVTTCSIYDKGLYADNYYYDDEDPTKQVVSNLAENGFNVTCSDMTDNGNGTYTWTYTVTKK